jgi:DNA-directed RNA polymerase subunit RPC12/RpoP
MADIHFFCALCGEGITLNGRHAGELVECGRCQRVVPVPGFTPPRGGLRDWLPAFPPEILAVEIKFLCGGCGSKLRIDARWEGRRLKCPNCASDGRVPVWSRALTEETNLLPALTREEIAWLSGDDVEGKPPASAAAGSAQW